MAQSQIEEIVFAAIDELNGQLPEGRRLAKKRDMQLMGGTHGLGSLEMVMFVVAIQERIDKRLGKQVALAQSEGLFRADGPAVQTVGSLIDYVMSLIGQAA